MDNNVILLLSLATVPVTIHTHGRFTLVEPRKRRRVWLFIALALAGILVLLSLIQGSNDDKHAKVEITASQGVDKPLYEMSRRLHDGRSFAFKIFQKDGDSSLNIYPTLSGDVEQPFKPLVKISVKSCRSGVVQDIEMTLAHVMVLVNGSTMTPPTKFVITNLRVIGPGPGQEQLSISFDNAEEMGGKVPDFAQCPTSTASVAVQTA